MFTLNIYSKSIKTGLGNILLFADARRIDRHRPSRNEPPGAFLLVSGRAGQFNPGQRGPADQGVSQGQPDRIQPSPCPAGTPFQLQVWEKIRDIPYGETMSYGDIARMLGNRNKARAVGGAANANPLPMSFPATGS